MATRYGKAPIGSSRVNSTVVSSMCLDAADLFKLRVVVGLLEALDHTGVVEPVATRGCLRVRDTVDRGHEVVSHDRTVQRIAEHDAVLQREGVGQAVGGNLRLIGRQVGQRLVAALGARRAAVRKQGACQTSAQELPRQRVVLGRRVHAVEEVRPSVEADPQRAAGDWLCARVTGRAGGIAARRVAAARSGDDRQYGDDRAIPKLLTHRAPFMSLPFRKTDHPYDSCTHIRRSWDRTHPADRLRPG